MQSSLALALFGLTVALSVSGCVTRQLATMSASDAGGLDRYMSRLRQATTMARPATSKTELPTAESSDAGLAAALAELLAFPSADRHLRVAVAYRRMGITDKAHEHFTAAAAANRANPGAADGLARVWRDWGLPDLALPYAHRAAYHARQSATVHNTLGTVLQALGRYPDARRAYETALSLDSRAAYAMNNLCALELLEGRPDAALAACQRALTLDPALLVAQQNLERAATLASHSNSRDNNGSH